MHYRWNFLYQLATKDGGAPAQLPPIDEDSYTSWQQKTGLPLPSYPQQKNKFTKKVKATRLPAAEVKKVDTSLPPSHSRAIVGYKQPMAIYNSKVSVDTRLPLQMVVEKTPVSPSAKSWKKFTLRSLSIVKQLRSYMIQQQQEDKLFSKEMNL